MMHIVSDPTQARLLDPQWRSLCGDHPFRSLTWLLHWWEHYCENGQLLIWTRRDEAGQLVCAAPLFWDGRRVHSRVRFLGSGNACTDYQSPFVRPGQEGAEMVRLAAAIDEFVRRNARWSSCQVEFDGVEPTAAWYAPFRRALQQMGYGAREELIESAYVASLPDNWDSFVTQLPSSGFRRKIRGLSKQLQRGEASFHRATEGEALVTALDLLESLHQRRRALLGQPGSYADGKFGPLLRSAIPPLADAGQAEVQWIQIGETPIAAGLILLQTEGASMYVSGVDPDYMAREPGHLMVTASITDAIARGRRSYDFLRGDEPYKQFWSALPRPMQRCFFTPPSAISQFVESTTVWARRLKGGVKQVLSPAESPS